MGAPRLSGFVHAVEMVTDDQGRQSPGRSAMFGPGDSLPDWAVAAISNPDVWDGDPPARPKPEPTRARPSATPAESPESERARLLARLAELGAADTPDDDGNGGPPPKGGAGSGAPAWREYAARNGVQVSADASREDVIAALEAAQVRTE